LVRAEDADHHEDADLADAGQNRGDPIADEDRAEPAPGERKSDRQRAYPRRKKLRRIGMKHADQPVVGERQQRTAADDQNDVGRECEGKAEERDADRCQHHSLCLALARLWPG
jgi:hypothetical protein